MAMSCHHFAREPAKSIIFAFNNNLYANDKGDKPIESRIGRSRENQCVAGRTTGCKSDYRIEVVYEHLTA